MLKIRLSALALAGFSFVSVHRSEAATLQEDFASDPASRGWKAFGDTNLFQWNAAEQNLEVTWDSSRPNSYFCRPLGTVLGKDDNFSLAFDLRLSDFAAGVYPPKTNTFQLSVSLINLSAATQPGFIRGTGSDSPDLVEFAFFPDPGGAWIYGPSITPLMVDSVGTDPNADWAYGFAGLALTTNDLFHIEMVYTASNQTLHTTMTRNINEPFGPIYDAVLPAGFQDFRVDHIAVCSYSDAGQIPDYAGSIYARGTVDNFALTLPPAPLGTATGGLGNQVWQTQFASLTNWLYTLERTTDFQSWTNVSPATWGNGATLLLQDTNVPLPKAFYRIRADRP